MRHATCFALLLGGGIAIAFSAYPSARQSEQVAATFSDDDVRRTLDTYCVTCHNQKNATANLSLDLLDASNPATHAAEWEKVVTKLRARTMPPGERPRPDAATYKGVASYLETKLDRAWAANPNPGRINAVHRLNRQEYRNAIRDVLALDIDAKSMLPPDGAADGSFDNMANVLTISPAQLDRYLTVARHATRLAVGLPPSAPVSAEFGLPRDHLQEDLADTDLPLGSRGGIAARYTFPADGEYLIKVFLHRNYQDYVIGMGWQQLLDVRLDGKLLKRFTVGGGALGHRAPALGFAGDGEPGFEGDRAWEDYTLTKADADLEVRTFVKAGPGVVGVAFPRDVFEPDGVGNPPYGATGEYLLSDQHMAPARVAEVRIAGPYKVAAPATNTPSRREILVCQPASGAKGPPRVNDDKACAYRILSRMARRAYRRPVTELDVQTLLTFFDLGRNEGGSFDAGIQMALERMLVDPDFLLRVYQDPAGSARLRDDATAGKQDPASVRRAGPAVRTRLDAGTYRLSDLEVASRLSFFLWSSVPDEQLLKLAEAGRLTDAATLRHQVQRMLADPRAADALVQGFVTQWLNLRRLEEYTPEYNKIRDAGRALLYAFPVETEMFVASTLRENRSIVELLNADYTFVNETLARHYGIPNVYGSHFRRVTLTNVDGRGGLLGHAGVLALTSYPDRTSPVLRGKWLLDNILDAPVPPPPDDVNATLPEAVEGSKPVSMREQLAQHRTQARCATCHSVMDQLGFALEGFDEVGRWRATAEPNAKIDDLGSWPGGVTLNGFTGLRAMLVDEREQFARTVTRKLMSYALGRELEHFDEPSVRAIARGAAEDGYRWSAIVTGIVESPAFLMRRKDR
jgi:mono/diheme cytochrome c family protein